MQSLVGVLLVGFAIFVLAFFVVYRTIRKVGHERIIRQRVHVPNGHTAERARRLEEDSGEYRNVLIAMLIEHERGVRK